MSKFIGIKMIEAVEMTAGEARAKGYRVNQDCIDETAGFEVTYEGGYKSWSPADVFQKYYYKLSDVNGDKISDKDVRYFIKKIDNVKVGTKTTNTTLTCLTGFEVHGQASCVNPNDFDINVGANYAEIKAADKIWECLGFALQWAKYGLDKKDDVPPHVQRMIDEHNELKNRINKLHNFITTNKTFNELSDDEKEDMRNQLDCMSKYIDCLNRRLERLGLVCDIRSI